MENEINWLEPWHPVEDPKQFLGELEKEVSFGHSLYRVPLKTIGRRYDCDDVLFQFKDDTGRVAMVHLTWSMKPENDTRWPATQIFASLADWANSIMVVDHEKSA